MTFTELLKKWDRLLNSSSDSFLGLGINHPLKIEIGFLQGYKSLIIQTFNKEIKDLQNCTEIEILKSHNKDGNFFAFQLVNEDYDEEFIRFAWDLIESTYNAEDPLNKLIEKYNRWINFFKTQAKQLMSLEQQKGLIGELYFLNEMLNKKNEEEVINAWCGPDGADQDFLFDNYWVEIKTVAYTSSTVTISSFKQLAIPYYGNLVVYKLKKGTQMQKAVSLVPLIKEIRGKLENSKILDLFDNKLFLAGYQKEAEDSYNSNWFRIMDRLVYRVEDDFPRIIDSNLPVAITKGTYSLDLNKLEDYKDPKWID